jgi:predicted molibdopterin-dependent oxidoreductase YjgC
LNAVRLPRLQRGDAFEIEVNGEMVAAYVGETVASVLLAAGVHSFQHISAAATPGRVYCGMGVCMQCLVTIDGVQSCQACKTLARPGMKVKTQS